MNAGRTLVTGSTGVIGRAVLRVFEEAGREVVGISSAQADLRDGSEAVALFQDLQPETVIHLAGRVHGLLGNARRQGEMFLDNVRINTNVVEAARVAGARKVVAMGSVSAYPGGVSLPMTEGDLWQGPPHGAEAGYAHAKRAMLGQLEAYKDQYGLDYVFALSTNLFGPHDRFDEQSGHVLPSLISKFERAIKGKTDVTVWGTGRATRDFLYSVDAARGLLCLADQGDGTYNLASGSHVTIKEVVDLLVQVTGYDGEVHWDTTKPDGQALRSYDVSRINALGWTPKISLEDGLRETWDWYTTASSEIRR